MQKTISPLHYLCCLCVCFIFAWVIFSPQIGFAKDELPPQTSIQTSPLINLQEKKIIPIEAPSTEKLDVNKKLDSTKQIEKTAPPKSQFQGNKTFGWPKYFQAIGTTLFLLVLLWYGAKILRKYGSGRFLPAQKPLAKDSLYLEGQIPLGHGKGVVVVKVLNKRLILGVTEHSINLLTEADIDCDDNKANFQNFMDEANSSSATEKTSNSSIMEKTSNSSPTKLSS